ncbi:MAG: YebC/PmpR family DNA-binding transcriptional regulator [Fimbriimonadaceae bacterium]|nr:YebC/PmpR family DNA-binding transcriptional regulator [Fimbriimonadaceae bacterium]
MSGHSKWATIKRKKEKNDHARGKVFSRHAREIMVAARDGGGNAEMNARLRLCIQKARGDGMPSENIERAIKKGTGELEGEKYEELVYEGYGPHGVAIMIDAMTDNRNRTVGEIRAAFNKCNGSLGESGCVSYQFETKGVIRVEAGGRDEDAMLEVALEAGAEDLRSDADGFQVVTGPTDLMAVVATLEGAGLKVLEAELAREAQSSIALDEHQARQVLRLIDLLDDIDDVQQVHGNFDIDEKVLEAISA